MGIWGRWGRCVCVALALFVLAACGRQQNIVGVEDYVKRFERLAAQHAGRALRVGSITIDFDHERMVDLGQCETGGFLSNPHIRINEAKWMYLGETQREILIFHELGHCVLNRLHRLDFGSDGNPASIMYPTVIAGIIYERNKEYYLRELFGSRR